MNNDQALTEILAREGGATFTDNPADRGGPTKFGITIPALSDFLGHPATRADVEALDEVTAREVYRVSFIMRPGIGRIANDTVRSVVLEAAVLHSPKTAIKLMQRALSLPDDGVIGPVTLAALPHLDGTRLAVRVLAEELRFFGRMISGNLTDADRDGIPDNTEFAAGWLNRKAAELEEVAG